MAISAGQLSQQDATDILRVLADGSDVNATIVKQLVAEYVRDLDSRPQAGGPIVDPHPPGARHNASEAVRRVARLHRSVEQLRVVLRSSLDPEERQAVRAALQEVQSNLTALLTEVAGPS